MTQPTELGYGRVWITASKSRQGVYHTTLRKDDATWSCTCEGQKFQKKCRHVDDLREQIDGEVEDFEVNL